MVLHLLLPSLLALGLIGTTTSLAAAQAAVALGCGLEPGPTRAVARVIDGETVKLDDGVEVRLIGALAPRARDVGADGEATAVWPPEIEARDALSGLVGGASVALAFAGRRADRHGRVLAHLFFVRDGLDIWVQGRLIEMGHARVYSLPDSDACVDALLLRESQARMAGLGLWANAAYQIRPADPPTELMRYRSSFQLVRGRVERGRGTRNLAILELHNGERPAVTDGASQRGAFRVVWKHDARVRAGLERPEQLAGRNVLARGWIDARAGPEIEVLAAGQIQLED